MPFFAHAMPFVLPHFSFSNRREGCGAREKTRRAGIFFTATTCALKKTCIFAPVKQKMLVP
jgi:hypothetical protein